MTTPRHERFGAKEPQPDLATTEGIAGRRIDATMPTGQTAATGNGGELAAR